VGSSSARAKLQILLTAIKATSLLTLGPIVAVGQLGLGIVGGLFGCPFSIPFVLCQICPTPCTFYLIRPWLFGGIITTSPLTGRVFCGLICPIGNVGSLLYRFRGKKFSVSGVGARLKYMRYGAVILFLYMMFEAAWISLDLRRVEGFWSFMIENRDEMTIVIIAAVLMFLILSTLIYRPWCRYLCPIGTLLSMFNRFSLLSFDRDPDECLECDACRMSCPLNLQDSSDSTDCFRCLSCYTACRRGVLRLSVKGFRRNSKRGSNSRAR